MREYRDEANNGGEEYSDYDYRRAMAELTSFSFTAKNLHDDAPDSLAMLTAFISKRPRIVTVAKRLF